MFNDNDVKTCIKCIQQILNTEFNKCISYKTGLESYCKNCTKNDTREYFRTNFSKALSRACKDGYCSCISNMGCDPNF